MKRRVAVLLGVALAALGLSMGPARAAAVLVVDDHMVLDDCHVGDDPFGTIFGTIQQAVDEAGPGDHVRVCPGEYHETVTVPAGKDHLTIEGAKAGIDARSRDQTTGESIVTADSADGVVRLEADGVVWDGFLIADNTLGPGMYTSPAASGYAIRNTVFLDNGLGLYLNTAGAARNEVRHNRFTENNEFEDVLGGYGIYSDQGASCVLIAENLFEGHNGAGILFADSGKPQHCITVERNRSIEDRSFATFFASSHVRLVANFVSGRPGDPTPGSAIFIGAGNDGVVVKRNRIEFAAGNGIDVRDTGGDKEDGDPPRNVDVLENQVREGEQNGIDVAATGVGEYRVRHNRALGNRKVGLLAETGTDDIVLTRNLARGNGEVDCRDQSTGDGTAGTDNRWRGNVGDSDDPHGICQPHQDKPEHKHKRKHHKHKHKHGHHHGHKPIPCFPRRN
jgi:nitrous oxidase accessory protein NosD